MNNLAVLGPRCGPKTATYQSYSPIFRLLLFYFAAASAFS